jgi:hypothetical protein
MTEDRDAHIKGLLRLLDPGIKDRAGRLLTTAKGRSKWLERLCHNISMHPEFTMQPPRAERSDNAILQRVRQLGAPSKCYVIASDNSDLDDTFQDLDLMVRDADKLFGHGTILSCLPGKLAVFRDAGHPTITSIVYRPK